MDIQEAIKYAREVAERQGVCADCQASHEQLAEWLEELVQLRRFYEYWEDLAGMGLNVDGWHLNGALEPLETFFASAVEEMEGA